MEATQANRITTTVKCVSCGKMNGRCCRRRLRCLSATTSTAAAPLQARESRADCVFFMAACSGRRCCGGRCRSPRRSQAAVACEREAAECPVVVLGLLDFAATPATSRWTENRRPVRKHASDGHGSKGAPRDGLRRRRARPHRLRRTLEWVPDERVSSGSGDFWEKSGESTFC